MIPRKNSYSSGRHFRHIAQLSRGVLRLLETNSCRIPGSRLLLNLGSSIGVHFRCQSAEHSAAHILADHPPADLLAAEALLRKLSALTLELSGLYPTILERLVVGRVVTCWFHLHYLDRRCARS